jgi:hypothetical protein
MENQLKGLDTTKEHRTPWVMHRGINTAPAVLQLVGAEGRNSFTPTNLLYQEICTGWLPQYDSHPTFFH